MPKRTPKAAAPAKCTACAGEGWVREIHRAGRGRKARDVGEVEVLCPTCLGSGTTPE
ncbi:hypothetical protein ACIRD3_27790 [Kitasatospora sp. NPDC093550]|uniref:hypothetical protein n=1 Tax=Kitasatospora sp. NPDC093550 TaxID=3364089 RepID=UPI0037F54166